MSDLKTDNSDCIGFGRFLWCMVHYSNSSKFSGYQEGLVFSYNSIGKNVSNYEQYNETLSNTMQGLVTEASYGNWTKANFSTRAVEVTGSHEKIFALVQCAADLSPVNCSKCLGELYSYIPDCCNGSQGGVLVHANCLMKYNNQPFFGLASHSFMPSYIHVIFLLLFTMHLTIM
ncbi:putative cysteine-rich repeat secretory protein 21 [Chenopodium quinoa]|uniref:putative cysteine-rich repeat secretory protein 21 n=1 Tax=Chenopodium quinoa TaxID=63459 RepID=UPI000B778016|nr:putative cysteine-rich repeat secretory protein 21 [Chenopodium quinoa]